MVNQQIIDLLTTKNFVHPNQSIVFLYNAGYTLFDAFLITKELYNPNNKIKIFLDECSFEKANDISPTLFHVVRWSHFRYMFKINERGDRIGMATINAEIDNTSTLLIHSIQDIQKYFGINKDEILQQYHHHPFYKHYTIRFLK